MACTWTSVCATLWWGTHMRPLKHNSSFGKEAKVEKEQEDREERRKSLIRWQEWEVEDRGGLMYPREGLSLGLEDRGGKTGSLASGLSLLQQVGCWQFSLNAWVSAQRYYTRCFHTPMAFLKSAFVWLSKDSLSFYLPQRGLKDLCVCACVCKEELRDRLIDMAFEDVHDAPG